MQERVGVFSEVLVLHKIMMKIEVTVNKCGSKNFSGNIHMKSEKSGNK